MVSSPSICPSTQITFETTDEFFIKLSMNILPIQTAHLFIFQLCTINNTNKVAVWINKVGAILAYGLEILGGNRSSKTCKFW